MDMKRKIYQKPLAITFCIDDGIELLSGSDSKEPKGSRVYEEDESDTSSPALSKHHSVWNAWDDEEDSCL